MVYNVNGHSCVDTNSVGAPHQMIDDYCRTPNFADWPAG